MLYRNSESTNITQHPTATLRTFIAMSMEM